MHSPHKNRCARVALGVFQRYGGEVVARVTASWSVSNPCRAKRVVAKILVSREVSRFRSHWQRQLAGLFGWAGNSSPWGDQDGKTQTERERTHERKKRTPRLYFGSCCRSRGSRRRLRGPRGVPRWARPQHGNGPCPCFFHRTDRRWLEQSIWVGAASVSLDFCGSTSRALL